MLNSPNHGNPVNYNIYKCTLTTLQSSTGRRHYSVGDSPRYAMVGIGGIEEKGYLHQLHPEAGLDGQPAQP